MYSPGSGLHPGWASSFSTSHHREDSANGQETPPHSMAPRSSDSAVVAPRVDGKVQTIRRRPVPASATAAASPAQTLPVHGNKSQQEQHTTPSSKPRAHAKFSTYDSHYHNGPLQVLNPDTPFPHAHTQPGTHNIHHHNGQLQITKPSSAAPPLPHVRAQPATHDSHHHNPPSPHRKTVPEVWAKYDSPTASPRLLLPAHQILAPKNFTCINSSEPRYISAHEFGPFEAVGAADVHADMVKSFGKEGGVRFKPAPPGKDYMGFFVWEERREDGKTGKGRGLRAKIWRGVEGIDAFVLD